MSRPVVGYRTASKESYDKFCQDNPSVEITYDKFKEVIYTYNSLLVTHMLETGEPIKFPFGLGEVVVNKYKPKRYRIDNHGVERINMPIDWAETKKQGKHIYHLNMHTEGYKFYWMWNYWKSRIKHAWMWKFEMARVNSRLLKTYLKKPNSKHKDIYREHPRTR